MPCRTAAPSTENIGNRRAKARPMPIPARLEVGSALLLGLGVLSGCRPCQQQSQTPPPPATPALEQPPPRKPIEGPLPIAELEIGNPSKVPRPDTAVYLSYYDLGLVEGKDPTQQVAVRGSDAVVPSQAIDADIGITGVDYAVAETGSCVIFARKDVSRLVSLLPPVHITVVRRDQILPSLDELFTMCRAEFLASDYSHYVNIISGPSRSADIEQTLITGMHGPRDAYMIVLD